MKTLILLMVFGISLVSGEGSEEYECEEGVEFEIGCGGEFMLPTAIASRGPFFRDAVAATCRKVGEDMVFKEEQVYRFSSSDSGMSVSAACPHEHHVVQKMKFCMEDEHVTAITLYCKMLNNTEWIIGPHEATSDEMHHSFVRCNEDSLIQSIDMTDSGDGVVTRVALGCLELAFDDEYPPEEP